MDKQTLIQRVIYKISHKNRLSLEEPTNNYPKLYHGRSDDKYLKNDRIILWQKSFKEAVGYAELNKGKTESSLWQITDSSKFKKANDLVDGIVSKLKNINPEKYPRWLWLVEERNIKLPKEKITKYTEDEFDIIRDVLSSRINPKNIETYAEIWEQPDFFKWFKNEFPSINGVLTKDGAVTFSPKAGNPIRIL